MMRRIDLLPSIYEQRRQERRNLVIVGLIGVALVALLLIWYFALGLQVAAAQRDLDDRRAQNVVLTQQIAELQQFATLESEVQTKQKALQTVMAGDLDWPAIMTEIAMVIPDDVWLDSLTTSAGQTAGAATVPTETNPIDIDPRQPFGRIQFEGEALSMRAVANWLIRLGTIDEFLAVYLGSAEQGEGAAGGAPTFTFSTTLELGEDAVSNRFQEDEDFLEDDEDEEGGE